MGKVGTGKSFSGITLGVACDETYNVARVTFGPDEFMTVVRSDLPLGSAMAGEEIGEWMAARNYKKTDNIELSGVFQTFRDLQLIVISSLPEKRMADKNLRTMGDILIETLKINRKECYVECKMFYIETNARTSESYEKYPVMTDEDGNKKTITRLRIYKPPEEFIGPYKVKKKEFNERVKAKAHQAVRKSEGLDENSEEVEDIRHIVRCRKCKYEWRSNALRPRCGKCDSSVVVVVDK